MSGLGNKNEPTTQVAMAFIPCLAHHYHTKCNTMQPKQRVSTETTIIDINRKPIQALLCCALVLVGGFSGGIWHQRTRDARAT
jgi:hypothetical protein